MAAYKKIPFTSITGETLERYTWQPEGKIHGILQLVHGMAEHIARYDSLGNFLADKGFVVVGHNHLGHGNTAKVQGFFAKENGWDALLADMHKVREAVQVEHPGVPYFLLGHSMGSFLTRCYLKTHSQGLKGAVLSGTGAFSTIEVLMGLILSKSLMLLGRGEKPAKIVDTLAFSANNRPFAPAATPFDWLSRDQIQVKKYVDDPLCGFVFTACGYHDLFTGLKRLNHPEWVQEKSLPMLFMSGARDPVGKSGMGVKKVIEKYEQAGLKDITFRLYPDARHEVLNETNRQEVFLDLAAWLKEKAAIQIC